MLSTAARVPFGMARSHVRLPEDKSQLLLSAFGLCTSSMAAGDGSRSWADNTHMGDLA